MESCWKFCGSIKLKVISFGLLLFLSMLNEVQSDCSTPIRLQAGKPYYVYYSNNPGNGREYRCWKTVSQFVTRLKCNIKIPESYECTSNSLTVKIDGYDKHKYCGYGTFVLEDYNPAIELDLSQGSKGSFDCEFQRLNICDCGRKNPTRIVGGRETGVNEYPMMTGLVDAQTAEVFCGATIIDLQYVITVAHCVRYRNLNTTGVIVGMHDIKRPGTATKLYRIIRCKMLDDRNNGIDIAICKINGTIEYSNKVGTACLPFQHAKTSLTNSSVTLMGWGTMEYGGPKSPTLLKTKVTVLSHKDCQKRNQSITKYQMCTYTPGKDACQMDSGGPALWQNNNTGRCVLDGIIASGQGCAGESPGIETRVGAFINWILYTTPEVEYCDIE